MQTIPDFIRHIHVSFSSTTGYSLCINSFHIFLTGRLHCSRDHYLPMIPSLGEKKIKNCDLVGVLIACVQA